MQATNGITFKICGQNGHRGLVILHLKARIRVSFGDTFRFGHAKFHEKIWYDNHVFVG